MHQFRLFATAGLLIGCAELVSAQPAFHVISNANVYGISGDGSTLVGMSGPDPNGQFVAMRWRWATGIELLGGIPEPFVGVGTAFGVNFDGTAVVGQNVQNLFAAAFRWTEAIGMEPLGYLPGHHGSSAHATSADGGVVVGNSASQTPGVGAQAFRWTAEGGMAPLLHTDGLGWASSRAFGVSADGAVVAGDGLRPGTNHLREPFRWTQEGGITPLLPMGVFGGGEARGVSADGSTIVGHATRPGHGGATLYYAFRWHSETGLTILPFLPGAIGNSRARDVSGDGSVVVGDSDRIWVWTPSGGTRYLHDILADDFGVDLTGYTLEYARGVSDDGTRITGLAWNHATGYHEAFVATIPGPASAACAALPTALGLRRQRRPRRRSRPAGTSAHAAPFTAGTSVR